MTSTEKAALGDIQASGEAPEQGEIKGDTGCTTIQLADLLEDHAKSWGDQQLRRFWVLKALCELTKTRIEGAPAGFSHIEIWEQVNKRQKWLPLSKDPSVIGKAVRLAFEANINDNLARREPLARAAAGRGLDRWPVITATTGGGSSIQTRYRIEAQPFDETTKAAMAVKSSAAPGEVQYELDVSVRLGFFLRKIEKGLKLTGIPRAVFLVVGALLVLSVFALGILAIASILGGHQVWHAAFVFAAYSWLVYTELLPPYRVISARALKAPLLIQRSDDYLLLEWRGKPRYPASELHVVRYLGSCPLCKGTVNVDKRYWWSSVEDLVGRCENARRQHVFTFDHELKIGMRIPPNR